MSEGSIRREKAITGRHAHAVEDKLPLVGRSVTSFAGNMSADEQVGIDFLQEGRYGPRRNVPPPHQRIDGAAVKQVGLRVVVALEHGGIERRQARRRGQAMTQKNTIRRPHGQRHSGEQLQVRGIDLVGPIAVSRAEPLAKQRVVTGIAPEDDPILPLGQLVVAEK